MEVAPCVDDRRLRFIGHPRARLSTGTLGQQVQSLRQDLHRQWHVEQAQMRKRHVDGPCGSRGGSEAEPEPKGGRAGLQSDALPTELSPVLAVMRNAFCKK